MNHWVALTPAGIVMRRLLWTGIGAALAAPATWLWASWVAVQDARRLALLDRQAFIEQCADERAVAVEVLNTGTVTCVGGSNRRAYAPLAHPLRGK